LFPPGSSLIWSVNVSGVGGFYSLDIQYANGTPSSREASVVINGKDTFPTTFSSTNAWDIWKIEQKGIALFQGQNTIELISQSPEGLPNIDKITIGGLNISAGSCEGVGPPEPPEPPVIVSDCPLNLEGFGNGTTGGAGGRVVTVTNQSDLERYAKADQPYIIKVQGAIKVSPKGKEINVESNKTIIGVGTGGEIVEGGFFIGYVENVIIRNLTIRDTYVAGDDDGKTQDYDAIQIDEAKRIWIDHNHLTRAGDGLIDSRKDTTNLTVSWNILSDHNKAFGIGWTENVTTEMTIHHNILRNTGTRNPSTDNVLRAHLYNNWLNRAGGYGNWARGGTNMVIENSVFENMKNPHYYDSGSLVSRGNIYKSTSGRKESSGSSYSFFNPSDHYNYTLHPANEVKDLLSKCAGPRSELGR